MDPPALMAEIAALRAGMGELETKLAESLKALETKLNEELAAWNEERAALRNHLADQEIHRPRTPLLERMAQPRTEAAVRPATSEPVTETTTRTTETTTREPSTLEKIWNTRIFGPRK